MYQPGIAKNRVSGLAREFDYLQWDAILDGDVFDEPLVPSIRISGLAQIAQPLELMIGFPAMLPFASFSVRFRHMSVIPAKKTMGTLHYQGSTTVRVYVIQKNKSHNSWHMALVAVPSLVTYCHLLMRQLP